MTSHQAQFTNLISSSKELIQKAVSEGMRHTDNSTGAFQKAFNHLVKARNEVQLALESLSPEIAKELYSDMEIES